jgi:hypothetical protein
MSEAEAQGIRMVIDHYEPREAQPGLVNDYSNLMYSCDECNARKGDRCPPPAARTKGLRFFRPDQDAHQDHFAPSGIQLDAKTPTGDYTIDTLDLNRGMLRKMRHLRQRLTKCDRLVAEGVLALRKFHIDLLPPHIKASAARAIKNLDAVQDEIASDIDSLLRDYARSALLGVEDPEEEKRAEERMARLKGWEGLYAGSWRAPRKTRRK